MAKKKINSKVEPAMSIETGSAPVAVELKKEKPATKDNFLIPSGVCWRDKTKFCKDWNGKGSQPTMPIHSLEDCPELPCKYQITPVERKIPWIHG